MRILIDIGHPGHVHLFRPFAQEMMSKGHDVLFTCRQKEFEIELLRASGLKFVSFGRHYKSKIAKVFGLLKFDMKMLFTCLKYKPDLLLSHGSFYASHAAFLVRKPHISFEDTFNFEQIRLYKPFTKVILTSDYQHPDMGRNNIQYEGYHELAYLHPNQFAPDEMVLNELGVNAGDKYCLLRFVSWEATHDINHHGLSIANKRKVVHELSKYSKVFISSEKPLPNDLKQFAFPLKPERMHDILAFATLVFGESATMISEGAMLGVPGVYLDNTGRLYTNELDKKYGLVYNFTESLEDQEKSINKAVDIVKNSSKTTYTQRRKVMLSDKIDVTSFLVWFVEEYPKSVETMQKNPNYQKRFK